MTPVNAGVTLWARSELRQRWGALALLAVLVAVGGGAAIAAVAAAHRTETAFPRMLAATNQPNVGVLGVTDEGIVDLDASLLDRVMQVDGVTGAAQFAWMAVAPEGFPNYFALALVELRGESSPPILLEGSVGDDIESIPAEEVLLNEAMQRQLGLHTGDALQLSSLSPEQFLESLDQDEEMVPGGPSVVVRIAAVARSPEDVSDAPDPFLLFPPAFYAKYHGTMGSCVCNLLINADPAAVESVIAELGQIYPNATVEPAEDLSGRIADTVALQRRTWWVIAVVAALAGAIALFLASARVGRVVMTGEDTRRALGMTRRERRTGRFLILAPAVLLGAAGALGVAYALSPLAPVGLSRLAEPTPGLRWDPGILLPGILLVLIASLIIVGVASLSAHQGTDRLDTAGRFGGPQVALGNRLAFGPGRGAIVGVLLATAGLVGAFTLERSVDHILATPALYGADFDASNFLDSGADKRALAEQLIPDPEVEAVGLAWEPLPAAQPLEVVGPGGPVHVEPRAFESLKGTVSVKQTQGRTPSRPDEVAVGSALLDGLGASIGDRVTATGSKGTIELTIVGDDLDPGVDIAGQGFAMTLDGLSRLTDVSVAGAVVRFAPGTDRGALIDRYAPLNFTPITPPSEVLHIGQLGGLPGRVGQLLAVLAVIALLNGIVLSLRLGRREVALHRALGFTSGQVVRVHLWQSVVIAVTGVVIGGTLGFVVGRAIERQLVNNVGAVAKTSLPGVVWLVVIATIAVCLFAGVATSALALRRRPGLDLRAE